MPFGSEETVKIQVHRLITAVVVASALVSLEASAISIGVDVNGVALALQSTTTEVLPGLSVFVADPNQEFDIDLSAGNDVKLESWNAVLKEDPYVTSNAVVTNLSNAVQTYVFTVILPISPFAYSQIVASSIGLTVTDSITTPPPFVPGATLSSAAPQAIYTGLINGLPALTLFPDPTTLSCAAAGCSTTQSSVTFNGPAGPGVATSIALTVQFNLAPGDSGGFTSRFEIIPEPGTLLLSASGLLGISLLGRRRR
jgi:hypothetical protein